MGPTYLVILLAGAAGVIIYRGPDKDAADKTASEETARRMTEGFHPGCAIVVTTIDKDIALAPPVRRLTTENGSQYEICANKIRRVTRGPKSQSERFLRDWREAEAISAEGVGFPIIVTWGTGRDEHSPAGAPDDASNTRATVSSRVVNVEVVTL